MFEELNTQIENKLSELATIQETAFENNGRYERIKKIDLNDFSYSVTEYKTPNDEFGYQVIFNRTVDGKEYSKSVGYGVEAEGRTSEWSEIIKDLM